MTTHRWHHQHHETSSTSRGDISSFITSCSCLASMSLQMSTSHLLRSCSTSIHVAASTEVVYHREPRDFAAFKEFQLRDGISDRLISRWHPRVDLDSSELSSTASYDSPLEPPMSNAKSKLERQPGAYLPPKFSLDFDILPDVLSITRWHDWGENGARRYPYTWFDSLPQVGEKVDPFIPHYLRFSGGHFRQIFNIYRFLSRFSTRTLAV